MSEKQINEFINIWKIVEALYKETNIGLLSEDHNQNEYWQSSHSCGQAGIENYRFYLGLNRWFCNFRCDFSPDGESGTAISLVCTVKKCSKEDAIKWVNDLRGASIDE
jgi:hypothetical protein